MSIWQGSFKGDLVDIFTNEEGAYPKITLMYKLSHEEKDGEWDELAEDLRQPAYYTYLMKQEISPGKTYSSYAVSKKNFKKTWGMEISDNKTVEELKVVLQEKGEGKVLKLVADDYQSHKIGYINNPDGKKHEGMVDLSTLLRSE